MKKIKFAKKLFFTALLAAALMAPAVCFANSESEEAVNYYNKGIEYVNKGEYQMASTAFQKALEFDPEFVDAYYNLGSIYEHFGDFETALYAYTQVVAIEPRDYEARFKAANIFYMSQMYSDALEFVKEIPENSEFYAKAQEIKNSINKMQKGAAAAAAKQAQTTAVSQQKESTAQNRALSNSSPVTSERAELTMEGRTKTGGYTDPDKTLLSKYSSPTGIAVDNYGNIFVASYAENVIYKVTRDERNRVFSDSTMIDGPIGLVVDGAGNLYVANYNKNNILKISASGNVSIFKENVARPYSLEIVGNTLYVSEQGTNSVVKFRIR